MESGQKAIKNAAKTLTGAKRRAESSDKKDTSKLKKRPVSAQKGKLAKKRANKANSKESSAGPEQKLMKEFNEFLSSCSPDQRNQLKKAILQKQK